MENTRKGKGVYLRLKWGLLLLIGSITFWIIMLMKGIKSIKNIIYWSQIESLHLRKSNKWKRSESSEWFPSPNKQPTKINPSFPYPNNRGQQQRSSQPLLKREPPPNRYFNLRQDSRHAIILHYNRFESIEAILYPLSIDIGSDAF